MLFTGNKGAKAPAGAPGAKGTCLGVSVLAGPPGPKGSEGNPGPCDINLELHNKCKREQLKQDEMSACF